MHPPNIQMQPKHTSRATSTCAARCSCATEHPALPCPALLRTALRPYVVCIRKAKNMMLPLMIMRPLWYSVYARPLSRKLCTSQGTLATRPVAEQAGAWVVPEQWVGGWVDTRYHGTCLEWMWSLARSKAQELRWAMPPVKTTVVVRASKSPGSASLCMAGALGAAHWSQDSCFPAVTVNHSCSCNHPSNEAPTITQ
jgi:hypothetical protein